MKMKYQVKKHSLKLISAFISVFLWIYVLNSEKVQFEKTVALEYILPEDMMFATKPAQEVIFLIEGPRAFVRTVAEREDKLVIDVNRSNTRKQLNFALDINPAQLNLPFGMIVERVLPRKISISLEKKASKIVPVKLQFSGNLPERLALTDTEINHPEIEVIGPRSLITKLQEITTKPIDLENMGGAEEIPIEILLHDERLSAPLASDLKLSYKLKAASSNFELKNLPIKFIGHSQRFKSVVLTASVKLLVPEKILKNRLNVSSSVQIWADIPEDARGRIEVPLRVNLPTGLHLLEVSPKTIIVNMQ